MVKLVVALGNPGKEYQNTRHNIGWLFLDFFQSTRNLIWKEKFNGHYTEITLKDKKIYFLKPMTYMNLSGQSVQALISFFKISINEVLVVHDEIDLPFGEIALKKGGGFAGHNGLKSIAQECGSAEFLRVRLGIGKPVHGNVSGWVLSAFSKDEAAWLENFYKLAEDAMDEVFVKNFASAQNKYNGKKIN